MCGGNIVQTEIFITRKPINEKHPVKDGDSMHFATVKSILSPENGMNLYRGCSHGCIYCDSRSTCYQMTHPFEDIEVKENALILLEDALRRKRKKCMIGTGSMTDPYIPLETRLGYMRQALTLIERYGFGVTVLTKSDRILRDMDLLERIHRKTKAVVQMTLTTADEALCRKLEPNVSTTKERFRVLMDMKHAAIPTVVWLCPILPWINDTYENIAGILEMCRTSNVRGVICFGMGMTLRDGSREYFYRQLDRHFPGLKAEYIRHFGNQYVLNSPHHAALMQYFHQTCHTYGIMHDNQQIFRYLQTFEEQSAQLTFWD